MNCRVGTSGSDCASCDRHVTGSDCNQCDEGFWGIYTMGRCISKLNHHIDHYLLLLLLTGVYQILLQKAVNYAEFTRL